MTTLVAGDKAPKFSGIDQDGAPIKLGDYKGKKLILFFYPKDNTPGCTAAACSLRDHFKELSKAGYELLGVSPDSPKKHQNFIKKFDFPFPLLADEDRSVIEAFKCWGPKQFMGRKYDGVYRTTFIIDGKGVIEQVFTKVKTKTHAAQIMETVGS